MHLKNQPKVPQTAAGGTSCNTASNCAGYMGGSTALAVKALSHAKQVRQQPLMKIAIAWHN
jgi:hypothetical protein